jgi:tRNA (guanine37-N1)-methyltransferase
MLRVDVITLFPEMFAAVTGSGIAKRALNAGLWQIGLWSPRDFASDPHRTVDDRCYGGGPGMVLLVRPLEAAVAAARARQREQGARASRVVYLSPQGVPLTQRRVSELAGGDEALILLCGRYEGIDERLVERVVDEEISVGDYVVSGGELPAMSLIDAMVRLLPGATKDALSVAQDSFSDGLLDCPHYTRPEVYEDRRVPEVLLSGDHERIRVWRLRQSLARTLRRRPDLLADRPTSREEAHLLAEIRRDEQLCGQYEQRLHKEN